MLFDVSFGLSCPKIQYRRGADQVLVRRMLELLKPEVTGRPGVKDEGGIPNLLRMHLGY